MVVAVQGLATARERVAAEPEPGLAVQAGSELEPVEVVWALGQGSARPEGG